MIKKSYKTKQTLPATEFSSSQCDYGEAADSSLTHQQHTGGLGQGQAGDTEACPGPLPSRGRGGSEAALVRQRCQWEPCRRSAFKGSFQLASYSFVAECV